MTDSVPFVVNRPNAQSCSIDGSGNLRESFLVKPGMNDRFFNGQNLNHTISAIATIDETNVTSV